LGTENKLSREESFFFKEEFRYLDSSSPEKNYNSLEKNYYSCWKNPSSFRKMENSVVEKLRHKVFFLEAYQFLSQDGKFC